MPDARDIVGERTQRGAKLNIAGSVHDPTDPIGRLLFNALAMFAELEADLDRRHFTLLRPSMAVAARCCPDGSADHVTVLPRRGTGILARVPPRSFPSPMIAFDDEREVLLDYLDYFRELALSKVAGMTARDQAGSRLPSGWTPLQLLHHLRHVERRWLEWGFAGHPVADPWADGAPPAPLRRVLLHLLQEYARHVGHLDIVRSSML